MIILYALGYQLKPQNNRGIIKTGLIYVSTLPSGATVYVNKKKVSQKTPTALRGFTEGSYPVRIELKNHRVWEQNVEVENERASVLDRILLIPSDIPSEALSSLTFNDLEHVEKSDYLILNRSKLLSDYYLYPLKSKKIEPLLANNSPWQSHEVERIFKTPGSSALVMEVASSNSLSYLWLDPSTRESKTPKDISRFFEMKPDLILWSPLNRMNLITLQGQMLNHIDLESGTLERRIAQNIQGYTIENWLFLSSIIALSSEGWLAKINYHGKVEQWLSKDSEFLTSLFDPKDTYQISAYPDDLTLFFGSRGQLVSNRLPYRHADAHIRGYEAHLERKRILFWENKRVGFLSFVTEENSQIFFENSPRLEWLYTKGENIDQAFWVYSGSHILFKDSGHLFLLEFENYGTPVAEKLWAVKADSKVYYDEDRGLVYYLDAKTSQLHAAELVPKKEIMSIPMLELQEKKKRSVARKL